MTSLILNEKNGLDQFYTNPNIACDCIEKMKQHVDIDLYDIHLEPSVGLCAFFNLLGEKRIGIDISPKCEKNIICMNYLNYIPVKDKTYLVVGNPPFGKNSSLAVQFFNKSSQFADCICFILPRIFKRVSIQNKLNLHFELIYNKDLSTSPCCFTPKMRAKCCFQIWVRTEHKRKLVKYDKTHKDFSFLKHGPKDEHGQHTPQGKADFAIRAYGGRCGDIKVSELHLLCPKNWHWIKSHIDIEILKQRIQLLDFSICEDTVRQNSLGQKELIHLYKLMYG